MDNLKVTLPWVFAIMAEPYSFPDWLDDHGVDDARMGEAYESLDAQSRSGLKTCIARLHRIWGESPDVSRSLSCPRQGFCLEREDRPAEAAVIACAAGYRHPTAFLAALMPAVLAGVQAILPAFVLPAGSTGRESLPAAPLLAALELAGVERAVVLAEETALSLVRQLRPERSRLLLLGEEPFGEGLILHAHNAGLTCRSFFRTPCYWSERLNRAEALPFAAENASGKDALCECRGDASDYPVRLDADHESLWIWPDLEPNWFRLQRARLFTP